MPETVPTLQVLGIRGLLELPDDSIAKLLHGLEIVAPEFNAEKLSEALASTSQLPKPFLYSVTSLLVNLYRSLNAIEPTAVNHEEKVSRFLDRRVYPTLRNVEKGFLVDQKGAEWSKLRAFLMAALTLERTVGTTAKAGPVLTEHERIFSAVRIMTDLRPIYHLDVSEKPDGAVVIHMLKITQRDQHDHKKDFYFALDGNDLMALKKAIERAAAKEATLREMMKDSTVKVLDVELGY